MGDNGRMRLRLITSLILGIVTLPVIVVGLIDPLEGGLALLLALGLGVAVRLLSGVPVPRLLWIAMVATLAVGVLVLALVIGGEASEAVREVGPEVTAPNPLNLGARILLWVYRIGVLVVLIGAIVYLVRIAQALRASSHAERHEVTP